MGSPGPGRPRHDTARDRAGIVALKPEAAEVRLVGAPPPPRPGTLWIVCPWLEGLAGPDGLWLSALPIHDANAYLGTPAPADAGAERPDVFWGLFVLDLFRSRETLWRLARRRGIGGIVNLPSVSFFDGEAGSTLAALGFSMEAEVEALLEARAEGFRIGLYGPPRRIGAFAGRGFDVLLTAAPA